MNRPRIEPLQPPYAQQVQACFDQIMPKGMPPLNIFTTVAKNPRVLSRMINGGLLDRGSISIRQREIVILRVCGLCRAEYEWGVHVIGYGAKADLSQEHIEDTINRENYATTFAKDELKKEVDKNGLWKIDEVLIFHLVDQLHSSHQITDSLWRELSHFFSEEQLIELVLLCGFYHAISFVVNAFNIEPEEFAPRFSFNKTP